MRAALADGVTDYNWTEKGREVCGLFSAYGDREFQGEVLYRTKLRGEDGISFYFDDGYTYDDRTYRYLEGLKAEGYTVVSAVTRLTIQKGLGNLVRALAKAVEKYDRLVLLLAGDGEQRDELIRLAADLGVAGHAGL